MLNGVRCKWCGRGDHVRRWSIKCQNRIQKICKSCNGNDHLSKRAHMCPQHVCFKCNICGREHKDLMEVNICENYKYWCQNNQLWATLQGPSVSLPPPPPHINYGTFRAMQENRKLLEEILGPLPTPQRDEYDFDDDADDKEWSRCYDYYIYL